MIVFKNRRVDREQMILSCCDGKNVLHIGCLAADRKGELQKHIEGVAESALGLDIEETDDENVIQGDAQKFNLAKQFDVIVAGEVIEHLSNIEGFLDSCYRHLKKGGKLIISTPNAFSPIFLKQAILGRVVPNDQHHVLLFDVTTLKNMLTNYSNNMFKGDIFYYEERQATTLAYRMQLIMSWIKNGYSRGIIAELIKR